MKQIYQCDFCTMLLPKEEMDIHEKVCDYNVVNKTCFTCKNARMRDGMLEY